MNEKEKAILRRYLEFIQGFEESTVYEDYKEYEHDHGRPWSDEDYEKAMRLLRRLSK